jgi:hypothetical protein
VSVVKARTPANGAAATGVKEGPDKTVNAWEQGAEAKMARTIVRLKAFRRPKGVDGLFSHFMFFALSRFVVAGF